MRAWVIVVAVACGDDEAASREPVSGTAGTTIPVDDLEGWLLTSEYLDWPAEPAPHPSAGPHFGQVRTWLSPALAESLEAGEEQHPVGATAVKELYGDAGDEAPLGWSVMVRVGDGGGDRAWHWFEMYQGVVYADERGASLCSGCHADGVDFILTPW